MQQFSRALEDASSLDAFAEQIRQDALEIGATTEVFVGHQNAKRAGGSMHLDVMMPNNTVERAASLKFKSHEWTEAYALNRATSYVYAYDDLPKVHLATERVLWRRRNLIGFAPSSWMAAKVSAEALDVERAQLPPGWVDVRVRSDYLTTEGAQERIAKLRSKFSSFLTAIYESDLADEIIEAWISQFPTADLQDSALCLLEHITYVDPPKSLGAVRALIEANPHLRSALWVPLLKPSELAKSAAQVTIDYRSLKIDVVRLSDLTVDRVRSAGAIVFFDDALYTGTQSRTLLRSWFGRAPDANDAVGDRDSAIDPELVEVLKESRVDFAFYASHPVGIAALKQTAKEIGLGRGTVDVHFTVDSSEDQYTLNGLQSATAESREVFLDFIKNVGTTLLNPRVESKKWPEERPEKFALGYGGIQSTLVFRHSIATATPAVLWEMQAETWMPVLPRDASPVQDALRSRRTSDKELPEYLGN